MKSLADIVLPNDLQLINESSGIIAETERAIAGNVIYWYGQDKNANIDLVSQINDSWITYGVYKQIKELTKSTAAMTLIWGSETYEVIWRHEEPPVLSAIFVHDYSNPADSDFMHSLNFRLRIFGCA